MINEYDRTKKKKRKKERRETLIKSIVYPQAYQKAVQSNRGGGDLRVALAAESTKQVAPRTGPRIVQHTTRSNKVIDTEKTLEKQELKSDGLIVTEKKKTVEHEEVY